MAPLWRSSLTLSTLTLSCLFGSTLCVLLCVNGPDRTPPFNPIGGLAFCTEFQGASCCTTEVDAQLQQRYNEIAAAVASNPSLQVCLSELRDLLCARCSPNEAVLYDAVNRGQDPKPVPTLCRNYCETTLSECLPALSYLVNNTQFLDTTQWPDYFCELWSDRARNDSKYCFPATVKDQAILAKAREVVSSRTSCVCLQRFKRGLQNPVVLTSAGGAQGYVYVGEQYGVIRVISAQSDDESDLGIVFLNISTTVQLADNSYADERGLLGLTFHPDFANNRRFYVLFTTPASGGLRTRLSEFTALPGNRLQADPASERILLEVDQPRITNNGGDLLFGDDGFLYVPIGDGGLDSTNQPQGLNSAQNRSSLLGKILRIDVDTRDSGREYGIPRDNPFTGEDARTARDEVYAYGVRNVWKCAKDAGHRVSGSGRGRILCVDAGVGNIEVNSLQSGGNYGWNARNGNTCIRQPECDNLRNEVRPLYVKESANVKARGGLFYRGCANAGLQGVYVYGEFENGKLYQVRESSEGSGQWTPSELGICDQCSNGFTRTLGRNVLALGQDGQGEMYVLSTNYPSSTWANAEIHRIIDPLSSEGARRGDPSACSGRGRPQRPDRTDPPTTRAPATDRPSTGRSGAADLVFVLDASRSVGRERYVNQVLEMVALVVEQLDLGPTAFRVGVVSFSDAGRIDITLNNGLNRRDLADRIRALAYVEGGTNTAAGLRVMRTDAFSEAGGARAGYSKLGVLFVDGESSVDTTETVPEAERVRQAGIEMLVVAVEPWLNKRELEAVSSTRRYVQTFDDLIVRETISFLTENIQAMAGRPAVAVERPCDPNPCQNNARCDPNGAGFICTCPPGYRGTLCGTPEQQPSTQAPPVGHDGCPWNPCMNGGTCVRARTASGYECRCAQGYSGVMCETSGSSTACDRQPCRNGGVCEVENDSYRCRCQPGYQGVDCEQRVTAGPCDRRPCVNGGSCFTGVNGGYECFCLPGFSGTDCEISLPRPCDSSPCRNGGQCSNNSDSYSCACAAGYEGRDCAVVSSATTPPPGGVCQFNPCQNGGGCEAGNFVLGYRCLCPAGYGGDFCEITDTACASLPCLNGGQCQVAGQGYSCICSNGFQGINCENAVSLTTPGPSACDLNACLNGGVCEADTSAIGYRCTCTAGYRGDFCEIPAGRPCDSNPCVNGGVCQNRGTEFSCACLVGFTGLSCENTLSGQCASGPCLNGATCEDRGNNFLCTCTSGYTGLTCDTRSQGVCECNPCQNGAICRDFTTFYQCDCLQGFEGTNCERSRSMPCDSRPCQNGGVCRDLNDRDYECSCTQQFQGFNCELAVRQPCDDVPCQNGATCRNIGATYECACASGFEGRECQTRVSGSCTPNPCQNEGRCDVDGDDVRCTCRQGYEGRFCETSKTTTVVPPGTMCAFNPCANGGTCERGNFPLGYRCLCPEGYDGLYCQNFIEMCASDSCLNGGTCFNVVGGFQCRCRPGYIGTACQTALSVSQACDSAPCRNGAQCTNLENDYLCTCAPQYTGPNCGHFQGVNACASSPCQNNAFCDNVGSGYVCTCPSGFVGNDCENQQRVACDSSPCQNGGTCQDVGDNFQCFCDLGYTGTFCQQRIAILPCSSNPCLNSGLCTNVGETGFRCTCAAGFIGSTCATVLPRDPCGDEPCLNGGTCSSQGSTFQCRCMSGFTGRNCQISDQRPCDSSPCQFGTCADRGFNYFCTCETGYTGKNCEQRMTGNCLRNPCQNGGLCSIVDGDIHCTCVNGYSGRSCERLLPAASPCDSAPCLNGAICRKVNATAFACTCPPAYRGATCDSLIPVVPPSPCDSSPCRNGATCIKIDAGTYGCQCTRGYQGVNCDERIPLVPSACDSAPCRNGATCIPLSGTSGPLYRCRCTSNYIGTNCGVRLPSANACDSRPCGNGGTCTSRFDGGFTCSCRSGFTGSTCRQAVTPATTTATTSGGVLGGGADIAFVIDSSGSVTRRNFEDHVLQTVAATVRRMDIGRDANQVGVITFSNKARLNIKLNQSHDRNALADAITRIPFRAGSTNTSGALWMMRDWLFSRANGSRDGYPKIGILLVDGEATIDPQHVPREASRVLADGVSMVTIGVGPWLSRTELSRIASDPDSQNQLFLKNFRLLNVDATHTFILDRVASVSGGSIGTPKPTVRTTALPGCPDNTFSCTSSQRCIPLPWKCDGTNDCNEGEDEAGCSGGCAVDMFACGVTENGTRCVDARLRCDGNDDCPDGSDERDCDGSSTPETTLPNPCRSAPCRNAGTCLQRGAGFQCQCQPGYSGSTCSDVITGGAFLWKCEFEDVDKRRVNGRVTWCDMEQGLDGRDDQFDWSAGRDATPSEPTGPRSAYRGTGYVFIEASGRSAKDEAKLYLPRVGRAGPHCLTFAYSMFGFFIERLYVQTAASGSGDDVTIPWSCVGQQGRNWYLANVQLQLTQAHYPIALVAVRGRGFSGDIAIDHVSLTEGVCAETSSNGCSVR